MSHKKYVSTAERQKAYRQRLKEKLAGLFPAPTPLLRSSPLKKRSRPQRLAVLVADIQALKDEYQAWLDALPENLADSTIADHLQETIDQLDTARDALDAIDPPRVGTH